MSPYKTKVDLLEYNFAAETKLNEFVVAEHNIITLDKLSVVIDDPVLVGFFKPKPKKISKRQKPKTTCKREPDCNLIGNNYYRYIGEAAGINDWKLSSPKHSISHEAVLVAMKGKANDQIIYIAQKIMCQILPVYLHYRLEKGEENIKCYYGSAKTHEVNIKKACYFMLKQKWISSQMLSDMRIKDDFKNYNLLIYEIKFTDALISSYENAINDSKLYFS